MSTKATSPMPACLASLLSCRLSAWRKGRLKGYAVNQELFWASWSCALLTTSIGGYKHWYDMNAVCAKEVAMNGACLPCNLLTSGCPRGVKGQGRQPGADGHPDVAAAGRAIPAALLRPRVCAAGAFVEH
eukprot:1159605-Pelagomonas_calceolata.AAC.4